MRGRARIGQSGTAEAVPGQFRRRPPATPRPPLNHSSPWRSSVLQVFNDDDVREHVDAPTAVRAVRSALLAHHDGTLVAPARVRAGLGDGDLVFTAGHLR